MKYGTGVAVSAENNSQMRLYALGALEMFGELYDIESGGTPAGQTHPRTCKRQTT